MKERIILAEMVSRGYSFRIKGQDFSLIVERACPEQNSMFHLVNHMEGTYESRTFLDWLAHFARFALDLEVSLGEPSWNEDDVFNPHMTVSILLHGEKLGHYCVKLRHLSQQRFIERAEIVLDVAHPTCYNTFFALLGHYLTKREHLRHSVDPGVFLAPQVRSYRIHFPELETPATVSFFQEDDDIVNTRVRFAYQDLRIDKSLMEVMRDAVEKVCGTPLYYPFELNVSYWEDTSEIRFFSDDPFVVVSLLFDDDIPHLEPGKCTITSVSDFRHAPTFFHLLMYTYLDRGRGERLSLALYDRWNPEITGSM